MDPISDMFIRIKNAQKAGHETVIIPHSKFKFEIIKALERAGLVMGVEKRGKRVKKFIEVKLGSKENRPLLSEVGLISKPSRRLYASVKNIPRSRHGGTIIISTSKGVMTTEEASKEKVGGQLVAEVW